MYTPESTDKAQHDLPTIQACLRGQIIGVSEVWRDTSQQGQNETTHLLVMSLHLHNTPAHGHETIQGQPSSNVNSDCIWSQDKTDQPQAIAYHLWP